MSSYQDTEAPSAPVSHSDLPYDYSDPAIANTSWSSAYCGIVRSISILSINIKDVLGSHQVDSLLTLALPVSTSTDSNQSQPRQVPPFATQPHTQSQPHSFQDTPSSAGVEDTQIIPSLPTIPRLKNALQYHPNIHHWLAQIATPLTDEHKPWSDDLDHRHLAWTPEGCVLSRESLLAFKTSGRLSAAQSLSDSDWPISPPANMAFPRSVAPAHREALIFQCEVTLSGSRRGQQCSVEVPASPMRPEMVNMMLELKNLNSFFGREHTAINSSEDVKPSASGPDTDEPLADDSDQSMSTTKILDLFPPVPQTTAPSPAEPGSESPSLAARRGKAVPSPILVKRKTSNASVDPYSAIPSAFLGISSMGGLEDTSRFVNASHDGPSLDVEDMMRDLQARCGLLRSTLADETAILDQTESRVLPSAPSVSTEDEWAFANDLLEECKDTNIKHILRASKDDWAITNRPPRESLPSVPSPRRARSAAALRADKVKSILKVPRKSKSVRFDLPDDDDDEAKHVKMPKTPPQPTDMAAFPASKTSVQPASTKKSFDPPVTVRPNSLPTQASSQPRPFAGPTGHGGPRASLLAQRVRPPRQSPPEPSRLAAPPSGALASRPTTPESRSPSPGQARKPSPLRECCATPVKGVEGKKTQDASPTSKLHTVASVGAMRPSSALPAASDPPSAGPASAQPTRRSIAVKRVPIPSTIPSAAPKIRPASAFTVPRPAPTPGQQPVRASVGPIVSVLPALGKKSAEEKENVRPALVRVSGVLSRTASKVGLGVAGLGKDETEKAAGVGRAASKVGRGIKVGVDGKEATKSRMPMPLKSVLSAIPKARQLARGRVARSG